MPQAGNIGKIVREIAVQFGYAESVTARRECEAELNFRLY